MVADVSSKNVTTIIVLNFHFSSSRHALKRASKKRANASLNKKQAKEIQRQQQQGLGRPIISAEFQGYRFVAVGSKVHYGKWKTFHDFLGDYIKRALGEEWGNTELKKSFAERHPILRWYHNVCTLQREHIIQAGNVFSSPMTGAASAYYRLAYNLYLIAHNGSDIQTRLLARLRNEKTTSLALSLKPRSQHG